MGRVAKKKPIIYFSDEQDIYCKDVTDALVPMLEKATELALKYEDIKPQCEISITFTDNESIKALNSEHRKIDRATDVLSFPLCFDKAEINSERGVCAIGDIVISLERADEQANEFGHSFEREIAFLCVHSVLHLLGYDHELSEEDDADMRRRQREILEMMGLGV